MSPLCVLGLATALNSCLLPVLMVPTWGLHLGMDSGPVPPTFLFNDQHKLPPPSPVHSFAFYQERGNECPAIDFQGISAPRDGGGGDLSSQAETHFFPSLINFLLLSWQPWLYISIGNTTLQN